MVISHFIMHSTTVLATCITEEQEAEFTSQNSNSDNKNDI